MALAGQVVDVPFVATNQLPPQPGVGPQGRLTDLINSVVERYIASKDVNGVDVTKIKTRKRDGFTSDFNAFTPISPRTPAFPLPTDTSGTTLIDDVDGDQLALIHSQPNVYVKNQQEFVSYPYNVTTQKLTQEIDYSASTVSFAPDQAKIGNARFLVWLERAQQTSASGGSNVITEPVAGARYMTIDDSGSVITAPAVVDGTAVQVRVVTDGTFYWVIWDDGTELNAQLYTGGTRITQINWTPAATTTGDLVWDVTYFGANNAVYVAIWDSTGTARINKLTTNGSTITRTSTTAAVGGGFGADMAIAWLRSTVPTRLYLARAVNAGAGSTVKVLQFDTSISITHTFDVATFNSANVTIGSIAGHTTSTSTGADIAIAYTELAVAPALADPTDARYATLGAALYFGQPAFQQCDNAVRMWNTTFANASTQIRVMAGAVLASKTFLLDDYQYVVAYIPDPIALFPAYVLMSFASYQNTAGEFELGNAYDVELCYASMLADSVPVPQPNRFQVPSIVVDSLGRTRFPLSYRNENVTTAENFFLQVGGDIAIKQKAIVTLATVGLKTWSLRHEYAESLRLTDSLVLPGPQGTLFNQAPTECGFAIAPFVLNVDTNEAGGLTGTYEYICVFEWTDADGNLWRSPPSSGVSTTVTSKQVLVQGRPIHATNKFNIRASIYRTAIIAGISSTLHYKVFTDLTPVLASKDLVTFSAWDNVLDTDIVFNETLYTDGDPTSGAPGQLPHYPAPAHTAGCIWQNRPCVVGDDNSIWIGGEFNPGDGLWWSPAMKILVPTQEKILNIKPLDVRMLIICEKSLWEVQAGNLPDATGINGTLPTPQLLPFTNGGTGPATATREGVVYASSTKAVWLIDRAMRNVWIGQDYQDNLAGTINNICVDGNQRVHVDVAGVMCVYDLVSGVWGRYDLGASITASGVVGGLFTVAAGTVIAQQVPGQTYDFNNDGAVQSYIAQSATVASIRLDKVRSYKRTWGIQVNGDTLSVCGLVVVLSYPDGDGSPQTITYALDPVKTVGVALPVEVRAKRQQSAAYGLTFTETQTDAGVFGGGFSLTGMTWYAGVQKGFAKIPATQRGTTT